MFLLLLSRHQHFFFLFVFSVCVRHSAHVRSEDSLQGLALSPLWAVGLTLRSSCH